MKMHTGQIESAQVLEYVGEEKTVTHSSIFHFGSLRKILVLSFFGETCLLGPRRFLNFNFGFEFLLLGVLGVLDVLLDS